MLEPWFIFLIFVSYLCLLFAIAYWGDKRADAGRSVIRSPVIYSLSIAVYCTSWTFYGSVGRAAGSGPDFLPIYLGPTLMMVAGWFVIYRIILLSKHYHITSIADLIGSRFGKSHGLAGLVTVIAVITIAPYIALQLKAVADSFNLLVHMPRGEDVPRLADIPILADTALYVALLMATFSILFGTRHIDATEHHEGMVVAIAFESVVKLAAFLAVGVFVTFGLFNGFGDVFRQGAAVDGIRALYTPDSFGPGGNWITLMVLSMAAIVCLPRQFQMLVVENTNPAHFRQAIWMFPLYLVLINLFVVPIAVAGLLTYQGGDGPAADMFVLALPIEAGLEWLALLAFIGGLSAATGMVIVAAIALSIMICNDLVMPALIRGGWVRIEGGRDLSRLLIGVRRLGIVLVMALGYLYFRMVGEAYALVTIGLVAFAGVAQFAPAIIAGIYWKGATRLGALAGLAGGFTVWLYTLLAPSFALSGWLPMSFVTDGPFGIDALRPYAVFGLDGMEPLGHALFWSALINIGLLVGVSLVSEPSAVERQQAALFVDMDLESEPERTGSMSGRPADLATLGELEAAVARFIGAERARQAFAAEAGSRGRPDQPDQPADAGMVRFAERLLAGAIGTASARVVVASLGPRRGVGLDEMLQVVDEAYHVIEYSRQLEAKSRELEAVTAELREANARLQELDRLKDEFISTVTHELRTPLTSIRSFSEILHDNPDLSSEERDRFLGIIIAESERLTRLINQVLDLAKLESGRMDWQIETVDLGSVIRHAVGALDAMIKEHRVDLSIVVPDESVLVNGDRDRLVQVVMNLVSNAAKAVEQGTGRITVRLSVKGGAGAGGADDGYVIVAIEDNGPGVRPEDRHVIFERFRQGRPSTGNPTGTGLGLPICRGIVEHLSGELWVEDTPGGGATFAFRLPLARTGDPPR